jgi:hypothetical protein
VRREISCQDPPPSTMVFKWMGNGSLTDPTFIIKCHDNKDAWCRILKLTQTSKIDIKILEKNPKYEPKKRKEQCITL